VVKKEKSGKRMKKGKKTFKKYQCIKSMGEKINTNKKM
jgi:hypothetical protein